MPKSNANTHDEVRYGGGGIFRDWLLNVGRREAYNWVAHLFCEMLVRLKAVGLAQDNTCDLPITQVEFPDAMGITTVHVNRVLITHVG